MNFGLRIVWALFCVAGVASGTARAAAEDGVLTVAVGSDIAGTEFATKHDDVTATVLHHVVEGLVAYRDDMTVAPLLAQSWSVSEDGRTYTFRLREGVTFHNGAPLTSAEVKWNWDRYRDPARDWGSHCREWYDGSAEGYHRPVNILAVTTPDPLTVVFTLQSPSVLFVHLMASNHCISGIVHPSSVDAAGRWIKPIGTGPFEFVTHTKGQAVELKRFARYSARKEPRSGLAGNRSAQVDRVRFVVHADPVAAEAALARGEVDLWFRAPVERARSLDASGAGRMHFQQTPAFHHIVLQSRFDPLLDDVRMRRAIAHAIDRDAVVREVTGGRGVANPSAVARAFKYHTAVHAQGVPFDRERARALAREAGYAGEQLKIQASRTPYPSFLAAAEVVARQLREAGFNASVEEMDWPTHDKNYGANQYQLTSITFSLRTDPALMYSAIVGQKADHSWYLWEDPEAMFLVESTIYAKSESQRQAHFDRLHQKMLEWVPSVGLFNHFVTDVAAPSLNGYETWTLGLPRLWGVAKASR